MRFLTLSIASLAIAFLSSSAFASFSNVVGTYDTLKLKIVNNTPYTLTFESSQVAFNVKEFNLVSHVIKPKSTAYFYGAAHVTPHISNGLVGTINFQVSGKKDGNHFRD